MTLVKNQFVKWKVVSNLVKTSFWITLGLLQWLLEWPSFVLVTRQNMAHFKQNNSSHVTSVSYPCINLDTAYTQFHSQSLFCQCIKIVTAPSVHMSIHATHKPMFQTQINACAHKWINVCNTVNVFCQDGTFFMICVFWNTDMLFYWLWIMSVSQSASYGWGQ